MYSVTEMLKVLLDVFVLCFVVYHTLTHALSLSLSLSLSPHTTALKFLFDYTVASCVYSVCHYFGNRNRLKHVESSASVEDMEVSDMKEKLKFHFMNPFQKWRYEPRRRFPWKLIVQLTSMFLVTLQVSAAVCLCVSVCV